MLRQLDELDRQVWDGRHMLEDVTHVLGGIGVGLLVYSRVARWARPLGFALLGLSALLHLYALVVTQAAPRTSAASLRQVA
jgi:hypothetical protein